MASAGGSRDRLLLLAAVGVDDRRGEYREGAHRRSEGGCSVDLRACLEGGGVTSLLRRGWA